MIISLEKAMPAFVTGTSVPKKWGTTVLAVPTGKKLGGTRLHAADPTIVAPMHAGNLSIHIVYSQNLNTLRNVMIFI